MFESNIFPIMQQFFFISNITGPICALQSYEIIIICEVEYKCILTHFVLLQFTISLYDYDYD
jgi:hypothetical protein